MNLKEKLLFKNRTRWLDIGTGGNPQEGFHYLDIFPEGIVDPKIKDQYFRIDILNATNQDLIAIGEEYDLVRMQHTFEHFSWEEGQKVLKNCAQILRKGGVILITVPDLRIQIDNYLHDNYKKLNGFKLWAKKRIPENAPPSFYFSIFAHNMPYESHKWCYDYEGLEYQLKLAGDYERMKEVKFGDPLSSYPFTHNRPDEDVCIVGYRK